MPCEEMTLARISPSWVTTAAQVSSQLVSMARIIVRESSGGGDGPGIRQVVRRAVEGGRGAPLDEGVLAVVLVVAAAQAGGAEAEALVEGDRAGVRVADLEREARLRIPDALEQLGQEARGHAGAAVVGVDGHVHDVPDGVVAGADEVPAQAAVAARGEADAARLRQLEHEHRERPRRGERPALHGDDLREVGVRQAADVEGDRAHGVGPVGGRLVRSTASGARTYSGTRASRATAGLRRASRQIASALTRCSGESSAGTVTAAGSSCSLNFIAPSPTASHASAPGSRAVPSVWARCSGATAEGASTRSPARQAATNASPRRASRIAATGPSGGAGTRPPPPP